MLVVGPRHFCSTHRLAGSGCKQRAHARCCPKSQHVHDTGLSFWEQRHVGTGASSNERTQQMQMSPASTAK
eukprot:4435957-Amphidinium_carterae.1